MPASPAPGSAPTITARATEPSLPVRIALTGPSRPIDLRVHAVRPDIADIEAAHLAFAPHYARARMMRLAAPSAPMLSAPDALARLVSQMLHGEGFALVDQQGDWAWGYSLHDHYVGYVAVDGLADPLPATHRVVAREALLFDAPDIKSAVRGVLPLGALLSGSEDETFLAMSGGYVHRRHVAPIDACLPDFVATAEMLLGAPYRWGGRGAGGIDCSGLVQLALGMAGIVCPRDSDMQMTLGDEIPEGSALRRGDIVFFPGHVGIMADDRHLLHANAHWMAVTREPLDDVLARLIHTYDRPLLARRRLIP